MLRLVYCACLISCRSNVATLVLKNRCVVMNKSGSEILRKESSRIFSGAILFPRISRAVEPNVSDIKALHYKDFC
jgi:hypothetical protein